MKPVEVKLRGFKGIYHGMGLEEVSFNFRDLMGLVALEGANGVGKTTFLENLQPFRVLPSRNGTIKTHCYLKNSFKDLTFEFNGNTYRTLVKTDPTTTRPDEGYIYLNGSDKSVVNGKVSNYDNYINHLLGSTKLYFSSIFCAQNSEELSDMRPAEIKNLYAEFLRLYRYVAWEQTSKDAARICSGALANIEALDTKIETKLDMYATKGEDLKAARLELGGHVEMATLAKGNVEHTSSIIEAVKKQVAESEVNRQRIKDHDKIIEDLKARQTEADTDQREQVKHRSYDLIELRSDIANQQDIVDKKWSIDAAVIASKAATAEIEHLNKTIHGINNRNQATGGEIEVLQLEITQSIMRVAKMEADKAIAELDKKLDQARTKYREAENRIKYLEREPDIVKLSTQVGSMEKNAAVLEDIDPACTSEVCGLITSSLKDQENLPAVRKELERVRAEKILLLDGEQRQQFEIGVGVKAHIDILDAEKIAALLEETVKRTRAQTAIEALRYELETKSLETAREQIEVTEQRIEELAPLVEKQPQLIEAETKAQSLEKEITRIIALGVEKEAVHLANQKETDKDISFAQGIINGIIINYEAEKQLMEAQQALAKISFEYEAQNKKVAEFTSKVTQLEGELVVFKELEREGADLRKKMIWIKSERTQWDYLTGACSKDGMRALEIEAVAPVLTQYANDMLTDTFGPTHTVRFETQDEEGREVLQIIVISSDGSETPLEFKSGGERVWILKALRLAQTLISQEKSGRHFQASLMDEEDGALSLKNALKFIKLYRTFIKTAKMDLCFYISHRPEAVAMADSIIKFGKGGLSLI
jgi:exonuclease SbcC